MKGKKIKLWVPRWILRGPGGKITYGPKDLIEVFVLTKKP